jgi:hypothetical protein
MNFDFLDKALWKPIGKGLSEVDRFVDREMPFDSGWGAPAAAVAAYFGAPYVMEALGSTGGGEIAAAEGSIGSGGMNSLLSNLGLGEGGSFTGQEAFQLPSSAYTPEYLNSLAEYNGVDAGNPSLWDRFTGNTEQNLYNPQDFFSKDQMAKKLAEQLLKRKSKSGSQQSSQPSGYVDYSLMDLPVAGSDQSSRHRALLAQQLRLLQMAQNKKKASQPPFDLAGLVEKFGTLS